MTYALETRTKTLRARQILEANEMKVRRKIVGRKKRERPTSQKSCSIQPINEWVKRRRRRREWEVHVTRMAAERFVKIKRNSIPAGRRSPGRPKKDGAN